MSETQTMARDFDDRHERLHLKLVEAVLAFMREDAAPGDEPAISDGTILGAIAMTCASMFARQSDEAVDERIGALVEAIRHDIETYRAQGRGLEGSSIQ